MKNLFWVTLIVFLLGANAWPRESWLCTEDSSQIQGSQILACGVGEGMNESIARKAALKSATEEFATICDTQTLCGEHKYRAMPSRATCEQSDNGWKCYRLVKYEVDNDEKRVFIPKTQYIYNTNVRDANMDLMDRAINKQLNAMFNN